MDEQQQLQKIESHLFQIKTLLIVIVNLCILGFYGLTRMHWDDIDTIMTKIWEVLLVIGVAVTAISLVVWFASLMRRVGRIEADNRPNKSE